MSDTFQSLHQAANAIEGATTLSGTGRVALAEQIRRESIDLHMLDSIEREARRVAQACSYVRDANSPKVIVMVKITREAYRVLYDATVARVPGPYISSDQNEIEANFTPETVAWLEEYTRPGETISDTIIRLSQLVALMRRGT